jgi:hypothetical protein
MMGVKRTESPLQCVVRLGFESPYDGVRMFTHGLWTLALKKFGSTYNGVRTGTSLRLPYHIPEFGSTYDRIRTGHGSGQELHPYPVWLDLMLGSECSKM